MRIISKLIVLAIVFGPQSTSLAQTKAERTETDSGVAAKPPGESATGKDEVIVDSELEGRAPKPAATTPANPPPEPERPSGEIRLLLRSRFAGDIQWEDPREEIWEATQLAILEARVRRDEHLRLEADVRVRHQFSALQEDTSDAESTRYELDAVPTAGYADVTIRDGLNLRAGYQIVHLGRFDVFSASNFLDALDLRNGPVSMPEAVEFAQLAIRVDWDPLSWLTLKVFYLPFFQPHLIALFDSDYAMFPITQSEMETALDEAAGSSAADRRDLRAILKRDLPRSARDRILQSGLSAFAPQPDLAHPQGALCLTARGPAGELGLTAGTALERLPSFRISEVTDTSGETPARAVDVLYNRFAVFALDGATDVGPVQLGVETAYMPERTWYADARETQPDTGDTYWRPFPERVDFVQLGLRGEYLEEAGWIAVLETFSAYALNRPSGTDREWIILWKDRWLYGAAAHVGWTHRDSGLTLETGAALFNGPSYLIAPRVEIRIVSEFYVETGSYFVGGRKPRDPYGPHMVLGNLYDGIDQVFVGLRWLP